MAKRQSEGAGQDTRLKSVIDAENLQLRQKAEKFAAKLARQQALAPGPAPGAPPLFHDVEVLPAEVPERAPPPAAMTVQVVPAGQQESRLGTHRIEPAIDVVTAFLSRYISKNSQRTMRSSLTICACYLLGRKGVDPRDVPWPSLRYPHVQALRTKLAADYAWASVNLFLLALRGLMKECWRLGLVEYDVYLRIADVAPLKPTRRETGRALTAAEVATLLAACDDSVIGRRDALIVTLTANAGLRRSEVCDLDVSSWDASSGKLQILGKGNKWRTLFLSGPRKNAIEQWLDLRGREPGPLVLALNSRGDLNRTKRLTAPGLYWLLQSLGERASVADFTPHDLRRTFITRMLEKGADALTLSKMVGHENVQTTMGYDKRGDEAKRKAEALLDDD